MDLLREGKCGFCKQVSPFAICHGCAEGDRLCTLMLTSENKHAGVAVSLVYK